MLFRGSYDFLSNFYQSPVEYNGLTYRCAEAAFQAQKQPERAKDFQYLSGRDAKRLGRTVKLRSDWKQIKDNVMEEVLLSKFSNPDLMKRLRSVTGEIVEDNSWGDTYWGRYFGNGKNTLGTILMKIRDNF